MVQKCQIKYYQKLLDRHLAVRGDKTAIIWEPNDPKEEAQHISYNELYKVNKTANVLREMGIEKGDRVCIYLPMIPELAYNAGLCKTGSRSFRNFCRIFCFSRFFKSK
jgi:acetyl-CoA synthetase